jgi:hypothetical protein
MQNSEVAAVVTHVGNLLAILKDGRVFHGVVGVELGAMTVIRWEDISSPIPGTDAGNP